MDIFLIPGIIAVLGFVLAYITYKRRVRNTNKLLAAIASLRGKKKMTKDALETMRQELANPEMEDEYCLNRHLKGMHIGALLLEDLKRQEKTLKSRLWT